MNDSSMVLFTKLDKLLYIQLKGEDDVWSLLSYNAYRSTFSFIGFADSCVPTVSVEDVTREYIDSIYKHYSIKDVASIAMLRNITTGNLEFSNFSVTKGALKNTGIYVDGDRLGIMEGTDNILEDVNVLNRVRVSVGKIVTRTDTLKTSIGILSLQTIINTAYYGFDYTLGEYSFVFNEN